MATEAMEAKFKHLEFIQLTIARMAANSFLIKGWSVTLIAALAALSAKDANISFIAIAFFPAFAFWGLDSYYLRQEKMLRKLYNKVRAKSEQQIDFSLNTAPFEKQVDSWISVAFSKTLIAFHLAALVAILVIMVCVYLIK